MDEKKYVPKKELTAFCTAGLGQGMIYALMSSYISDYYLNVLQLAPIFVLLLMLFARVWDAINDPMMGMIIDRSNLKSGKMKPFVRFALIPIAIMTLLMYLSPNLDKTQMMIYSAVVYVGWGMIYTVGDVAFWGIPNVITPSSTERSSVISISKIFNSIGSAVPEVLFLVIHFFPSSRSEQSSVIGVNGKALPLGDGKHHVLGIKRMLVDPHIQRTYKIDVVSFAQHFSKRDVDRGPLPASLEDLLLHPCKRYARKLDFRHKCAPCGFLRYHRVNKFDFHFSC